VKIYVFRVKFVKVCEWFDGCDRLKIIFKWGKNKITKLYFIFKKIKNYHYISLIFVEKNIKIYKMEIKYFLKKYVENNVIKKFIIYN